MRAILENPQEERRLHLQLDAMRDMRQIVISTYELEGDRLELLLVYDRIESLRTLGKIIRPGRDGALPCLDAVFRAVVKLSNGAQISKVCGERYASLKAHALIFLGLFAS